MPQQAGRQSSQVDRPRRGSRQDTEMSLEFFHQRKTVKGGPQFINTPGWIPGHAQRDDVRLHQSGVRKPDILGGAPLVNNGNYSNLQEAAIAPRAGHGRSAAKGSKEDKPKDLGERLAQYATKGDISCHKIKKSRERRRFLYRGDEFIKKALRNTKVVKPIYGYKEPVRLVVDYPTDMAGQDVGGSEDIPALLDLNSNRPVLKLPIASHTSRLKKQDDVAPIVRLLRMLGICERTMTARGDYFRQMLALATRKGRDPVLWSPYDCSTAGPLVIDDDPLPYRRANADGLPSAYPGLDYNTMRIRLRYAVEVDALGGDLAEKWVPLSADDDELCDFITRHVRNPERSLPDLQLGSIITLPLLYLDLHTIALSLHLSLRCPGSPPASKALHAQRGCLDIGAGCGDLTAQFMNIFHTGGVTATEVSKMMCRRLRQKGIRAVRTLDPTLAEVSPDHRQFDAVFCLNVLDRCKSPRKLLGRIAELVVPGGTVAISLPLPLAQLDALRNDHKEQGQERLKLRLTDTERAVIVKRLERAKSLEWRRSSEGTTITIEEHLDDPSKVYQRRRGCKMLKGIGKIMRVGSIGVTPPRVLSRNASFEEAARSFWSEYVAPTGLFELAAFTRCPYLCTGPVSAPILPLDDAVFVLTRVDPGDRI
ncbi:Methyltransferase-like protein 9 [Perkinsus olseni]|uniref:Methyltransferase-like protein 9 n=1 Tax=Perkinsus olseni TaxID=32597 RepID=A0A7J6MQT3_PEROL|nr:Methyltransferase-like protein 9 [Perkinsus olseni]